MWIAIPAVPPIVIKPSTKSRGSSGIGIGSQRSCVGDVGTSSNEPRTSFGSIAANGSCSTLGRIRYSHERFCMCRGAVNGDPENCSAYNPYFTRCGELPRAGNAPGSASVANSLLKPDWYMVARLRGHSVTQQLRNRVTITDFLVSPARARSIQTVRGSCLCRTRDCLCAG